MDELIKLLEDIKADADFETCETLFDDGILDSFNILSIVGELCEAYGIEILPTDMVSGNFNSAEALLQMIRRLQNG